MGTVPATRRSVRAISSRGSRFGGRQRSQRIEAHRSARCPGGARRMADAAHRAVDRSIAQHDGDAHESVDPQGAGDGEAHSGAEDGGVGDHARQPPIDCPLTVAIAAHVCVAIAQPGRDCADRLTWWNTRLSPRNSETKAMSMPRISRTLRSSSAKAHRRAARSSAVATNSS